MTRDQLDAYDALCAAARKLKPIDECTDWELLCRKLHGGVLEGETLEQTVAKRAALGLDADNKPPLSEHGQRVNAWAVAQAKAQMEGRRDSTPCPEWTGADGQKVRAD